MNFSYVIGNFSPHEPKMLICPFAFPSRAVAGWRNIWPDNNSSSSNIEERCLCGRCSQKLCDRC